MTLRVTVEMVPQGDERQKRTLCIIEASHVSEDTEGRADYSVNVKSPFGEHWHSRNLVLFRHLRSDGWAKLLKRALYIAMEANPRFGMM